MTLRGILAPCLAVLAIASVSCSGDNTNDNGNQGGDSDNNNSGDDDTTSTQYTLTLTTPLHGTLEATPAASKYDAGTVVTLTAVPDMGYKVAAWSGTGDDASISPTNHVTMTADTTVSVTFTVVSSETFTLTIDQNANGTVTANPAGPTYNDGTPVALTATPDEGYTIDTWSGTDDDTSKALTNHVTMTADKTVSATFKVLPPQKTLSITIDQGGDATTGNWGFSYSGGGKSGTHYSQSGLDFSTTFDEGTVVTLTGISAPYWPFEYWKDGDTMTTQCSIMVTMDQDHSLTAYIPLGAANDPADVCR